jgi:hypothetical protein
MDMRIVIGGDQFWPCYFLAASVIRRLTIRYGPDIVIVHGDDGLGTAGHRGGGGDVSDCG